MSIQSIGAGLTGVSAGFALVADNNDVAGQPPPADAQKKHEGNLQASPPPSATPQQINDAIKLTNDFVGQINPHVEFSLDNTKGQMIVKVMDTETKEVIMQMPSEEMLAFAKSLDKLKGLLIHQKA